MGFQVNIHGVRKPMDLTYSDEQNMLRDSVDRVMRDIYPFETRQRRLEEGASGSVEQWDLFAELGWLAIPFAEGLGGMGGTAVDVGLIMEGLGRALALEPYLPAMLAGRLVAELGTSIQHERLLTPMLEGRLRLALAFIEPQARYDLSNCTTRARAIQGGYVIDGGKSLVFGGREADAFVTVARTAGEQGDSDGLSFLLVERGQRNVCLRPYETNDGLGAADLRLGGVEVSADALLGEEGEAHNALERTVDYGIALISAEAVGAMSVLCEATLEYLKTRKQFGQPLASNQALQHRLVDMYITLEEARSSALYGALMADEPESDQRKRALSLTKLEINRTARTIGQEAVQLHGAMGMTEELAVGHYFKRLTAIAATFGDTDWHCDRIGQLNAH